MSITIKSRRCAPGNHRGTHITKIVIISATYAGPYSLILTNILHRRCFLPHYPYTSQQSTTILGYHYEICASSNMQILNSRDPTQTSYERKSSNPFFWRL